jgi:Fe2+ or Zn2+ uptake regulation protein
MQHAEKLIDLFRQKGLRITPQRRLILEVLDGDASHPTAEELYQRVVLALPDISRTTVYNTLRELVSLGELREVQGLSAGRLRYDTRSDAHHHLFCTRCQALIDIGCDLEISLAPGESAGYKITRYQVTFYGICPDCQRHTEQESSEEY